MTSVWSLTFESQARHDRRGTAMERPLAALDRDLSMLAAMMLRLSDAQYRQAPVGVFGSSIGGHVRHCLDHVGSFLDGIESGAINYDRRRRGTPVEANRPAALEAISNLRFRLASLIYSPLTRRIRLTTLLAKMGPTIDVDTTAGRELAFVLSHTTHHNAIIAAMTKTLNIESPDELGIAPSTAAFRDQMSCAQ